MNLTFIPSPSPTLFRCCWFRLWFLSENEVEVSLTITGGANVVQVFGFCFDAPDGKARVVLELCAHGSLRAHLKALPREKVRAAVTCRGHCNDAEGVPTR